MQSCMFDMFDIMLWSLVIAVLLGVPTKTPCHAMVYGGSARPNHGLQHHGRRFESDWTRRNSAAEDGAGGAAEALRTFASTSAMKTGTTIAGVIFEGGVVLGADTRATGGKTVCDRNCDKIHVLASNIACCGAGTSADAVRVTEGARLALLRLAGEMQASLPSSRSPLLQPRSAPTEEDGKDASPPSPTSAFASRDSGIEEVQRQHLRVASAAFMLKRHLFRYQGMISASLVLGGVDAVGAHLYQIHEGGSFAKVEFAAMGSGSLAALSVLEQAWLWPSIVSLSWCQQGVGTVEHEEQPPGVTRGHRPNLTEEEAKDLVVQAIAAGIDNDLGSGSNIDVCVITSERGLEHHRGAWKDPGLGSGSEGRGLQLRQGADEAYRGVDQGKGDESDDDGKGGQSQYSEGPSSPRSKEASDAGMEMAHTEGHLSAPLCGDEVDVEVGGEGGSRAWVGSVRRRYRGKKVVKVDHDGDGALRGYRCSALDDRIEII